jgi:hypothetical protein
MRLLPRPARLFELDDSPYTMEWSESFRITYECIASSFSIQRTFLPL